jgi:hypothetical protein
MIPVCEQCLTFCAFNFHVAINDIVYPEFTFQCKCHEHKIVTDIYPVKIIGSLGEKIVQVKAR